MLNVKLKLKICGMREPDNVSEVAALQPDYMGFIFYARSPRFVNALDYNVVHLVSILDIDPVAVFVNASVESICSIAESYGISTVQLHGRETPDTCIALRENGLRVIKAFSISDRLDLKKTGSYRGCCDYFLFDAKTSVYGGSGSQYNWHILEDYNDVTPFFLSGGIGPDDAERILAFEHPGLLGIDINSRFEIKPALKDVRLLSPFINRLKSKK